MTIFKNLKVKIADVEAMICSANSVPKELEGEKVTTLIIFSYKYEVNLFQILNLDNTKLCPSSQKFGREEWLTIFCILLALANMVLFTNLLYDYYQYYVNGKLPKIIKWIPYL